MSKQGVCVTRIEIATLPPSVNAMYGHVRGGVRFKTAEYKAFEVMARFMKIEGDALVGEIAYECSIDFYSNWFTKSGALRKRDLDNLGKAVLDAVCARFSKFDDSQIVELRLRKVHRDAGGSDKTVMRFKPLGRLQAGDLQGG
jgi:Holliday junction resolvase RusA-like endonuclease